MKEARLQSQLICYECEEERADSWWRLIGDEDSNMAREFLLGPKCRVKFEVDRPKAYGMLRVFGSEYEAMPI